MRGFNARGQNSEAITFSVFYRTQDQLQRWHKIGRFGVWTPDQARREAQRVLRARDLGEDPSGSRMALRNSMTMATLCAEYVADMDAHRINGKKDSTIYTDKSRIRKYIAPQLGKLRVVSVTQSQIEDFVAGLSPASQENYRTNQRDLLLCDQKEDTRDKSVSRRRDAQRQQEAEKAVFS